MTTDQINYLNIGLMLVSFAAALLLPFEVFLISYAILGPLHYLTEISWLHDRNYFTVAKWDWIPLVVLAVIFVLGASNIMGETWAMWESIGLGAVGSFLNDFNYELLFVAFGLALIMVFVKEWKYRALWTGLLLLLAWLVYLPANEPDTGNAARAGHPMVSIFGIYLPTLIHTYVFTGAFILFGALKRSSRTGYASFFVFRAHSLAVYPPPPLHSAKHPTKQARNTKEEAYPVRLLRLSAPNRIKAPVKT